ncbi:MAG TPA: alpha/beta hydrolase [Vicinamibacterales bacterium]|nr:alpha/beta hydrolase [Vicinamibacterales bacterium]
MKCHIAVLAVCASLAMPALAFAQVKVIVDVDYVAATEYAEKKDRLDIYVPDKVTSAPVIFSIHGGGLRQGDKSGQTFVGQRFASAGYIAVVVNHRLSPGVAHPAHIEDIAAAFAWVKKNIAKHGGDPERIFVIGHSAGAYLAALLALDKRYLAAHGLQPSDIRGVVPVSGFFYVDRPGVAPDRPKDTWGTDVKVWKAASPATYITRTAPPLLLVYADGDDPWRREQQGEFAAALRAAGHRDVETRMIAGRGHNSVWGEMAKGEEETSRAILQFVSRLAKPTSH